MSKLLQMFVLAGVVGTGGAFSAEPLDTDSANKENSERWLPATGKFLEIIGQDEHRAAVFEGPQKLIEDGQSIHFNEAVSCSRVTREGILPKEFRLSFLVDPTNFEIARQNCMMVDI